MGDSSAETKVPRLKADADFKSLPLEPADGYILSQMDGTTSVAEIGLLTGLGEARVQALVDKLDALGALEWLDAPPGTGQHRRPRPRAKRAKRPPVEPVAVRESVKLEEGELYDPAELEEEGVDLGPERRKFILDTFYQLDELTFYELLDVHPDADKTEIRTEYFRLSKLFHPDTMFGKRLGSFERKMESVFKRLTEAYEVLSKKKRRREYDAYIALRLKTLRAERAIDQGKKAAEAMAEAASSRVPPELPPEAEIEPVPEMTPGVLGASEPSPEPAPELVSQRLLDEQASQPTDEPSDEPADEEAQERPKRVSLRSPEQVRATKRQLMAKKLAAAAGRRMPGQKRSTTPPRKSQRSPADKRQALRGLASSLKATAAYTGGIDLAQRYIEQAHRQESEGDLVAATNSLRLALALVPDRQDIAEHHDRVAFEVARDLAQTYVAQANYEEANQKWADAALSWAKVCEGRPQDALPHWKSASCMLQASGDLRRAKEYAQIAVDLDPGDFDAQKTLGLVFHGAGMVENARRALETASELASGDKMVENLLRELKK